MPRTLLACLVCLVPAVALSQDAPGDSGAGALDKVLSNWAQTQRDMRSLVVEFRIDKDRDNEFRTATTFGVFRFVRTPDGDVRASYDLTPSVAGQPKFTAGLLDRHTVFILDYKQKAEFRIKLGDTDLIDFLAAYFNPLALLLDRKRAQQAYDLEVSLDSTHLIVKPKPAEERRGMSFSQAGVGWNTFDSRAAPKGMPWILLFPRNAGLCSGTTYVISSWRMNAADGPTVADLDEDVNLPGWQVYESDWASFPWGQVRKVSP